MKSSMIYSSKAECCGCGACVNVCSQNAICLETDSYGYLFPRIDEKKCIDCGRCRTVCVFRANLSKNNQVIQSKAAVLRNRGRLEKSASGGVFGGLAYEILMQQGVAYGCTMKDGDSISPHHIRIDNAEDLKLALGSKYVQSDIRMIFRMVREDLRKNKQVLFCGTPCQVAGLKNYLGKSYDNLYTIDLICHGVPNQEMFQNYLKVWEKRLGGKIRQFWFRDKKYGGDFFGCVIKYNKRGKNKTKVIPLHLNSYYNYFLNGYIYRESCYHCPFANQSRVGDITIGDYWGIEEECPKLFYPGSEFSDVRGQISCLLVNTEQGVRLIDTYGQCLSMCPTEIEKIARHNEQLCRPKEHESKREDILRQYKDGGWECVEKEFLRQMGLKRIIWQLWSSVPIKIQQQIKKIMKK